MESFSLKSSTVFTDCPTPPVSPVTFTGSDQVYVIAKEALKLPVPLLWYTGSEPDGIVADHPAGGFAVPFPGGELLKSEELRLNTIGLKSKNGLKNSGVGHATVTFVAVGAPVTTFSHSQIEYPTVDVGTVVDQPLLVFVEPIVNVSVLKL